MRWPTATIFVAISVATLFGMALLPLTGCGHTCYPIGYLCPGATIRIQPAPGQGTGTTLCISNLRKTHTISRAHRTAFLKASAAQSKGKMRV